MSIDKRPSGKYRARIREYPGGPERAKHFALKKDAERWEAQQRVALMRGVYLTAEQQRVTLGAFIESFVSRRPWWRDNTRSTAIPVLRGIAGHFGAERPMYAIRRGDVSAYVAAQSGRFSPYTVHSHFGVLRTLVREAILEGLIIVDPTLHVRLPPRPKLHVEVVEAHDVARLRSKAPPWLDTAIVLAAHAGLRSSETRGLLASDVDYKRRVVHVRRQLAGGRMPHRLVPPKTASSTRSVPVPDSVLELLRIHVEAHGVGREGVLLHRRGEFVIDHWFNDTWRRLHDDLGVPRRMFRFHTLRHTYASTLVSAGCSLNSIASAMGHVSPLFTLKTYAHLFVADDDRIRMAIHPAWNADSRRTDACVDGPHEVPRGWLRLAEIAV